MSDGFYRTLVRLGRPAFWSSSRPTVINAGITNRPGPFLLAANHTSPYDIPILMRHCHRRIDFVSITEVFRNPFTAWLYGNMNAFPLERSRPDAPAVRTILDRLERGRVVGMFPEGGFRRGEASVVHSRQIRPGIGRIAMLATVPIIPCAIIGSEQYSRPTSWLPLRRVRYGVAFGEAIEPSDDAEERLVDALVNLHRTLRVEMNKMSSNGMSLA
jgi:1-acyl-sn-glycerol-3-phosphate acyltransferase